MEICPGSTVQYTCHSTRTVSPITWHFICPDQEHGDTASTDNNSKEIRHDCATDEREMFSFTALLMFKHINSTTHSNMSITVPRSNYSIVAAWSLRIDPGYARYFYKQNILQLVLHVAGLLLLHN